MTQSMYYDCYIRLHCDSGVYVKLWVFPGVWSIEYEQ